MKAYSEDQLLDWRFRKQVIDEICANSNQRRKNEARKRHEVSKDNTVKYVLQKLQNEGLTPSVLKLMSNRATNISICRKVVDKLAKCYKYGVNRDAGGKEMNEVISYIASQLDFDARMKKADRYLRLQRNALLWLSPEKIGDEKVTVKLTVKAPWQYDAVENAKDPDNPLAIVFSDYYDPQITNVVRSGVNQVNSLDASSVESKHTAIADGPSVVTQEEAKTFIFWTDKYHFTCSRDGKRIVALSPEDNKNPFGEIPGVAMAKDRDDSFWASGGDDIADTAILLNTIFTDVFAILFMQGWGQLVITGERGTIPKTMAGGPHKALVMTYNKSKGQERPEVKVISTDPPVDSWLGAAEQILALLLTTNNLSVGAAAIKLDAANMASGVSKVLDKAESIEDVTDMQGQFGKSERKLWRKYGKMHNLYHSLRMLDADLAAMGPIPEKTEVSTQFNPGEEVMSESEQLDNLKKKKDLGLTSELDMLKELHPGMTDEEAKVKLAEIRKERAEKAIQDGVKALNDIAGAGGNPPDKEKT